MAGDDDVIMTWEPSAETNGSPTDIVPEASQDIALEDTGAATGWTDVPPTEADEVLSIGGSDSEHESSHEPGHTLTVGGQAIFGVLSERLSPSKAKVSNEDHVGDSEAEPHGHPEPGQPEGDDSYHAHAEPGQSERGDSYHVHPEPEGGECHAHPESEGGETHAPNQPEAAASMVIDSDEDGQDKQVQAPGSSVKERLGKGEWGEYD